MAKFYRVLGSVCVIGGMVLSLGVRVAPVVAAGVLLPGCGADCEVRECNALVSGSSSLTTNGGTYNHCITCFSDGTCETQLQDNTGTQFFDCTDGQGTDCTSAVVDAEFSYCDVQ